MSNPIVEVLGSVQVSEGPVALNAIDTAQAPDTLATFCRGVAKSSMGFFKSHTAFVIASWPSGKTFERLEDAPLAAIDTAQTPDTIGLALAATAKEALAGSGKYAVLDVFGTVSGLVDRQPDAFLG